MHLGRRGFIMTALLLASPVALHGQRAAGDSAAAIAVADSALAAISRGDFVALTDLMLDAAMTYSIRERDGRAVAGSRDRAAQRSSQTGQKIAERGFAARAMVSGRLAVVWVPYDLYRDGQWSHCGVDAFTMLRLDTGWRIASMAWSVDQPPVCQRHPAGPPL